MRAMNRMGTFGLAISMAAAATVVAWPVTTLGQRRDAPATGQVIGARSFSPIVENVDIDPM